MTSRFSNLKRVVALILTLVMVISAVPVVSAAPTKTDSSDLKADVVFAIDSTGSMSDEIRNVVKNLNSFTQYLEDRDVDIRIAIIDYKDITYSGERDSTVLHLKDYSPWYYTADDAAAVLSSLRVDGGGDGPETAVDALGCLLSDDIMFRSDAHKFAVLLTDYSYKNNNDYGYESMSEVVEELVDEKIYTSVITTSSFKSTYADLFEKTGGIYGDIYGDFGSILKELAERIFGITTKVTRAIYILPGYMGSQLYDDGELAWINMDVDMSDPFANPLINDIANNLLPGGESSKFAQNEDGTGIRVGVDIEDDQYGSQNTYKALRQALEKEFEGVYDVVFFPYNWLGDLNVSADLLKEHIEDNGYEEVVFITHSTGGLLAATFIADSTENKNLVEKAFLIAPPLYGTYAALLPIETGEYNGLVSGTIQNLLRDAGVMDMLKDKLGGTLGDLAGGAAAGGISWFVQNWAKDVTRNSPTTYQLLPNEDYLKLMAALYMDDTTNAVTTASEYYKVLNGSKNINDNLTNGNNRSHKYFRETVLGKDIASIINSVDSTVIYGYDRTTPAIAVYNTGLFGKTTLNEILDNRKGDGTVMAVSALCSNLDLTHKIKNAKMFDGIDHTALASNKDVIDYIIDGISDIEEPAPYMTRALKAGGSSDSMSDLIKLIVESEKPLEFIAYDAEGNVVASYTAEGSSGWGDHEYKMYILHNEDDGFVAQIYIPNNGSKVEFFYGDESGTEVTATLKASTLNKDGTKSATTSVSETITDDGGLLFTADTTDDTINEENLDTIFGKDTDVDHYDTDWYISDTVVLEEIGDTAEIEVTSETVSASDLTWSSSDESIVTVDDNGVVTAVGYGTAYVTALQPGSLKSMSCEVISKLEAKSVEIDDISMEVGEITLITPKFDSDSVTETKMDYVISGKESIISIDENGYITAIAEGSVSVTATAPGGATDTFTVTVKDSSTVAVNSINIIEDSVSVAVGKSESISAVITPSEATNKNVRWYVDDDSIASISGDGLNCVVTGVSNGTTTVYAVSLDGGYTDSCAINVGGDSDNKYTITATASTGGSISPEGEVEVVEGDNITFTITPDAGFTINKLLVDGEEIAAAESFTFEKVSANHAIEVSFVAEETPPAAKTFIITATAGTGGTISPKGEVEVAEGENVSFTISTDKGYSIKQVLVDGEKVTSAKKYTFEKVSSDHSIEVKFKKDASIPVPPSITTSSTTTTTTATTTTTTNSTTTTTTTNTPADTASKRLYGNTRYETAIDISSEGWDKADTVIVASGENYPDALAGTVLSKAYNAPILLTKKASLDAKVLIEIQRLGAKNVIILGGTAAVSQDVEANFAKYFSVSRIGGANRNDTAALVALKAASKSDAAFLVSNKTYADALSAGSAAALMGAPILYVNPDGTIPAETADALKQLGCTKAYIIGGNAAVDASAEGKLKALSINAERVYGNDRYLTSIAVYNKFEHLFTSDDAAIATGKDFPDALSGVALAAKSGMPVFLVGDSAPGILVTKFDNMGIKTLYVFGGVNAISEAVVNSLTK